MTTGRLSNADAEQELRRYLAGGASVKFGKHVHLKLSLLQLSRQDIATVLTFGAVAGAQLGTKGDWVYEVRHPIGGRRIDVCVVFNPFPRLWIVTVK